MNKKGQVGDMAFVLITLLGLAITGLVAGYVYLQIDQGLSDSGMETPESSSSFDQFGIAFNYFDGSFAFVLIALIIGLIISSFFIPTHPIFLLINIVGFLVLVFLGAVFSNFYSELILVDGLNTTAITYYPIMTFIMSKLPWVGAVLVLISSIVMYAKGQNE